MAPTDYQERLRAESRQIAMRRSLSTSQFRSEIARRRSFGNTQESQSEILAKLGFIRCQDESVECYACGFNMIMFDWSCVTDEHSQANLDCPFINRLAFNEPIRDVLVEENEGYPEWLTDYIEGEHVKFVVGLGHPKEEVTRVVIQHFEQTGTQHLTYEDLLSDVLQVLNGEEQNGQLVQTVQPNFASENDVDQVAAENSGGRVVEYPDERQIESVVQLGMPEKVVLSVANNHWRRTGRPYDTNIGLLRDVQNLQTLDDLMGGGHSSLFSPDPTRIVHNHP